MVIVAFKHMRKEEGGKCTRKRKIARTRRLMGGHKQIFSTLSRDVVYFVPFDSFSLLHTVHYRSCFFLSSLSLSYQKHAPISLEFLSLLLLMHQ